MRVTLVVLGIYRNCLSRDDHYPNLVRILSLTVRKLCFPLEVTLQQHGECTAARLVLAGIAERQRRQDGESELAQAGVEEHQLRDS